MLLTEMFNTPYNWKIIRESDNLLVIQFNINDIIYYRGYITLDNIANSNEKKILGWEIDFVQFEYDGVSFNPTYEITNTGNAPKIFATIIDIIKTFIKNKHPNIIAFSAKEPSRFKLYQRLVARLLPTWKKIIKGELFILYNPKGTHDAIK